MEAAVVSGLKCYQTVLVTIDFSPVAVTLFSFYSYSFPSVTQHGIQTARKLTQLPNKTCFFGKSEELARYLFFSPKLLIKADCGKGRDIFTIFIHDLYGHKCPKESWVILPSHGMKNVSEIGCLPYLIFKEKDR